MTPPGAATDTSATDTSAADAATKASADAATKAAADKAAADKAAADTAAAAAQKTPEQKAAEEKAAADKVIADKAAADKAAADAAEAAKKAVPDKYDLKLPDKSPADPAVVERTAAIARELGLSQDAAVKALGFVEKEVAAQTTATLAQFAPPSDTNPQGGAKWREQNDAWKAASLADKDLGAGKPEQLQSSVETAKRVIAKFGDQELAGFLERSGLGSNPAALKFLTKIGKAMSEGTLVLQGTATQTSDADVLARQYPSMVKKQT